MNFLLRIAHVIDMTNRAVGRAAGWLILIAVLISSANAVVRKTLSWSSNALLEIQWYLFAGAFLLCAGYTLLNKAHVRVDLFVTHMSRRKQLWVEILGTIFFLVPVTALILVLSWQPFFDAWTSGEISPNAGGLVRWPVKLLIPIGFALLLLQGVSEVIKDVAELRRIDRPAAPSA